VSSDLSPKPLEIDVECGAAAASRGVLVHQSGLGET